MFADSAFSSEEVKEAKKCTGQLLVTFYSTCLFEGYLKIFEPLSASLMIFAEPRRRCIVALAGRHIEYCMQHLLA
jgi:hypothetical protein